MLMGVAAVVLGGFVIICAAPFTSPGLYKTGGGLFLVSGTAQGALPHVIKYTSSVIGHLALIMYLCITFLQIMSGMKPVDVVLCLNKQGRCVQKRRFPFHLFPFLKSAVFCLKATSNKHCTTTMIKK